jgi:hypothetical protein
MNPANSEYVLSGGGLMSLAIRTDMTRAYTAKIPDMTIGMSDCPG